MLYIQQTHSISPQTIFQNGNMDLLVESHDKKMLTIEPDYDGIPPGILRRMGKAIRLGVGAAMPILKNTPQLNGIIIGTANGGMEDCIKFLNQIVQYEEGLLAPGNFVQSTSNAIAAQIGLLSSNKAYNCTHVHRGLAFENALLDAILQVKENPGQQYLLGGVDEISSYNYTIEQLSDAYKEEEISTVQLYKSNSKGSVAGEGAALFVVSDKKENAIAQINAISTLHSEDEEMVKQFIAEFIIKNAEFPIDLFLTGESGDNRTIPYYLAAESQFSENVTVGRFKHLCGEYPTASAMGLWYACKILQEQIVPVHMIKHKTSTSNYRNILIYNNFKGKQHSLQLVSGI